MLKKPGSKVLIVLAALLVSGLLIAATLPVMASGSRAGLGNGQGNGMGRWGGSLADIVSQTLGISRSDLATERQAGKSLVDIAADKGVDQEQLTKAVLEKKQEQLKQALEDKKITQTQYDQCTQQMGERIDNNLTRTETGPNGQGNGQGQKAHKNGGNGQGTGLGTGRHNGQCYCQQ